MNKLIIILLCVIGAVYVVSNAKAFVQDNILKPIEQCLSKKI